MGVFTVNAVHLVKAGARRDVDLTADNRMDARRLCRLVEVDHPVHDAVIRDGNRRLANLLDTLHQPLDPTGAVEQTVFGMQMQMDKSHSAPPYSSAASSQSLRRR